MNNSKNVNNNSLLEKIRAVSFVKDEITLFLDTHPNCAAALDYYDKTVSELQMLTEEYENTVGPLTAMGNRSRVTWQWVDGPWPWQAGNGGVKEKTN